jgi:hypothetical protein
MEEFIVSVPEEDERDARHKPRLDGGQGGG